MNPSTTLFRAPSILWLTAVLAAISSRGAAAEHDPIAAAQAYGKSRDAVRVQPDGLLVCEAEEFQVRTPGWQAQPWGTNYYAATFANTFLSRKAYLGAPAQCEPSEATIRVHVPAAGRYLALVRYEAAYRFETQFRVVIQQGGRTALDRLYGARRNQKIWPFSQRLKTEVAWDWGASENVVWEGHDAWVELQPGPATITLVAGKQPEPAARRNVDLVLLTTDVEQVRMRIDKEAYLPLDGLLTQAGDVFIQVSNASREKIKVEGQKFIGGTCQQHSPYWVHLRNWKPVEPLDVEPGRTTDWIDVGGLLDSLNDGQWGLKVTPPAQAEIRVGVKAANGKIEQINQFRGRIGELPLAFHADTRYSRLMRPREQVLFDLMDYLKRQPAHGKPPARTLVYGYTFDPGLSPRYDAGVREFKRMFALTETNDSSLDIDATRGYIDVRGVPTPQLEEHCRKLGDRAARVAVVSLGDEISLPNPSQDQTDSFRAWLRGQGVTAAAVDPASGGDWNKVRFDPDPQRQADAPGVYYWSHRYRQHFGIQTIKQRTDILRRLLPNAQIGANFSPHYPVEHSFLGETYKYVTCFRQDGMTLPWSEDYIFQVPVVSPQVNNIVLDLFRAANRGRPDRKIMYYVMPHWPGNTPNTWRRLFYGALAHGMKIVNLFEFRPVQVAYTENHVNSDEMYAMVLRSFRELGLFEDFVQDGQVRAAQVGLWFGETGDIWQDTRGSLGAGKRTLYTAVRHQQMPLDIVVEQDALDGGLTAYRTLYLTDAHVSAAAGAKIAEWVRRGGTLFATAGAGMFDELNRPHAALRELLGVDQTAFETPGPQVQYEKQDLPFVKPIDTATWQDGDTPRAIPVIGVRSRVALRGATAIATFRDGSPAVATRTVGQGRTIYCGFLPGLSYAHPAIPLRPVDRGSTDDAMCHFLPTEFDPAAAALIGLGGADVPRPVECGTGLVETTVIDSKHGVLIPLVNWSGQPISDLQVTVRFDLPDGKVSLASGGPVKVARTDEQTVLTLALDVADAVIVNAGRAGNK